MRTRMALLKLALQSHIDHGEDLVVRIGQRHGEGIARGRGGGGGGEQRLQLSVCALDRRSAPVLSPTTGARKPTWNQFRDQGQ